MRSRRIYGSRECCVYHCVTRTVNGEMLFGVKEKEVLRKILRQGAGFSGVELMTYAVMGNHFHVLVRVREDAARVDDEELMRRYRILYPKPNAYQSGDIAAVEAALQENASEGRKIREQLMARMGNVSEFMRTVKQRFSIWYNKSHQRFGPLWSERFKSVIVENDPVVVKTMAAYIDLNPVRAGLVKDPKDYRFCGYAEALSGDTLMEKGIVAIIGDGFIFDVLADYRMLLFGKGAVPKKDGSGEAISQEESRKVIMERGELPSHTILHQRIRFFSDGAVIGSSQFVEKLINEWSPRIGDRRTRTPQKVDSIGTLATFRRLRKKVA